MVSSVQSVPINLFATPPSEEGRNGSAMTRHARLLSEKKRFKTGRSTHNRPFNTPNQSFSPSNQPADIVQTIKLELEKTGSETYFIGKKVEDLLARVYFPSILSPFN